MEEKYNYEAGKETIYSKDKALKVARHKRRKCLYNKGFNKYEFTYFCKYLCDVESQIMLSMEEHFSEAFLDSLFVLPERIPRREGFLTRHEACGKIFKEYARRDYGYNHNLDFDGACEKHAHKAYVVFRTVESSKREYFTEEEIEAML